MSSSTTRTEPTKAMQMVLDAYNDFNAPPVEQLTPANARQLPTPAHAAQAVLGHHLTTRIVTPFPEPVGRIDHRLIPGPGGDILARIYTPEGDGPWPVLVYFHGGGWVIATLNTYDASCRALCNAAECVVISVAYRQAPEHKYPAAADDAFAAYRWARQKAADLGGDPERVAVAGESAGGNLAAVVSLMARDQGMPLPAYQLLVYPVTNHAFDTPSYVENANAKPLSGPMMRWFWKHYLPDGVDGSDAYASPLQASDFSRFPPTTIVAAEIDPLRSEGEQFAERLREAGVPVEYRLYEGVTHEFFGMSAGVPEAKAAVEESAADLKNAFGGQRRRA